MPDEQHSNNVSFSNQQPEKLADEIAYAESIGVRPIGPNVPDFEKLVDSGVPLIWAIDKSGNLVFAPDTVNHSVLVKGESDLGAGEINLVPDGEGGYVILTINNQSGHYKPSSESLEAAIEIFESSNIRRSF